MTFILHFALFFHSAVFTFVSLFDDLFLCILNEYVYLHNSGNVTIMMELYKMLETISDENEAPEDFAATSTVRRHKLKKEPGLKIRNVNSTSINRRSPSRAPSIIRAPSELPAMPSNIQSGNSRSPSLVRYSSRSPSITSIVSPGKHANSFLNRRKSRPLNKGSSQASSRPISMGSRLKGATMTLLPVQNRTVETKIVEKATLTVIGDPKVGKSSLLLSYLNKRFTIPQNSECFETYEKTISFVDNMGVQLQIWDFPGTELFDRFRPLGYADAKIIIICFQVDQLETLTNVRDRWIPEVRTHCPAAKKVMVGIGSEARVDKTKQDKVLDYGYCLKFANKLDCEYFECSLVQSRTICAIFDKLAASLIEDNKDFQEEKSRAMGRGVLFLNDQERDCNYKSHTRVTSYHRKRHTCVIA